MNDQPSPAPVDPDGFHCPVCGESWCSGCARPEAPSLSPAPACWQCGSMMDDDGYCANCADMADAARTDYHADTRPSRPAAPSLPMDLCSDIPEDDR